MAELSPKELLREWRSAMDAMMRAAGAVVPGTEVPRALVDPMQRQLELVTQMIDRGVSLQQDVVRQMLAPFDAVVDLVEQTGTTLRLQAEALETAAGALADASARVKTQAELFERTIGLLRQPTDRARAAAGIERRPSRRKKPAR